METSARTLPDLKKPALKNGLIWATVNIVLFLLVYYVKPDLMASFGWGIVQFFIGLALAIYFCLDLRKKAGGYWTFKEALRSIFLMFFVQAAVVFFFTIIFAKFIEPAYVDRMKEISAGTTSRMMEKMGMDQEEIDEAIAQSETALEQQFNPGFKEIVISLGTVAIMYFIGALIFAAILKKEPPFFIQKDEEQDLPGQV